MTPAQFDELKTTVSRMRDTAEALSRTIEDWRTPLISVELRKVILVASRFFEFLHRLGHSRPMHSVPVPINVRCYREKRSQNREERNAVRAGQ